MYHAISGYIMRKIKGHGICWYTVNEIRHIVREDLKDVSSLFDDKLYLFGEKPSSYDATAFAI